MKAEQESSALGVRRYRTVAMAWHSFLIGRGYRFDDLGGVARLRHPHSTDATCIDLSHHALLAFDGADARTFLQGYLTCDVNVLTPRRALLGAFCNLQGRVLADGLLVDVVGMPTFWVHGSLATRVREFLRKYLLFSRTKVRDLGASHVRSDVAPAKATANRDQPADARPAAAATTGTRSDVTPAWVTLGLLEAPDAAAARAAPLEVSPYRGGLAFRVPGEPPRWLLVLPTPDAQSVWLHYEALGRVGDEDAWTRRDVDAGWARVTDATAESFLPQMLGLTALGGVAFDKGCYLGQEIVARTEHRGELKRRLVRARWRGADAPPAGTVVAAGGRTMGTVIVAASTGDGAGTALAVTNAVAPTTARAGDVEIDLD
jgi:hypothetical protein